MQSLSEGRIPVRVGEVKVGTEKDVLMAVGLGSCVGIALYDPRERIAGLAHVMLPHPTGSAKRQVPPGRFATTAVEFLIDHMVVTGAERRRLFARLIGGASMFEAVFADDGPQLGQRNTEAAREALQRAGIAIRAEQVGGNHGRTVHFHAEDGRIVITSVRNADVII